MRRFGVRVPRAPEGWDGGLGGNPSAITTAAGPGGTAEYGYNADGNMTARKTMAGIASHGYDSVGRIDWVQDSVIQSLSKVATDINTTELETGTVSPGQYGVCQINRS
nr:hypothetical protein [Streptomyces canus]